jgi:hypothetical protein
VLLLSTVWCIPHLGVSYTDLNSSSIGVVARNTNSNSNSNNSSIMLLLHCRSRLQSGHHSRLPTAAFCASTMESWDILPVSASCQSQAIHLEQRQPWLIIKRAHIAVLHHRLTTPAAPPWMRYPWEKKFWRVCSPSTNVLLSYYLILEHHMTL